MSVCGSSERGDVAYSSTTAGVQEQEGIVRCKELL